MNATVGKVGWKLVAGLSGAAAGAATRSALTLVWRRSAGGDPPDNPASPQTGWREALIWAASSGVAMGVMRLVAARGAAEAWKAATGDYPAELETAA